jgi:hypothetical protein
MKCFIVGTNLRESGNEREHREGREKRERNGSKRHEKDTYQKIPLSKPQSQLVIYYQSNGNKKNLKENATEVSKKEK